MPLTLEQEQERIALDRSLAGVSFEDFACEFVKLQDPPPGAGVIQFQMWPHLLEVTKALRRDRLVIWLKARQIGASWLLAAYGLWRAMYSIGATVLFYSQGEREASELLWKARFVYQYLPPHITVPLGVDNRSELEFPASHSRILALPSTSKAGRSVTATLVVMDEADYHEDFEANYSAAKPTIDAGGQMVLVSTSNWATTDSGFKKLYRAAPDNGFAKLFFGWAVRPGRDSRWYATKKREATDHGRFEKEYPDSAEQALAPVQAIAAFDREILERMRGGDVREPVERVGVGRIWQRSAVGKRYAAFTDTSHGTGQDYGVTVIMDVVTGMVVADVFSNAVSPEELAAQSVKLLERYDKPLWAIEDNDWGRVTLVKAKELNYPRLYERKPGELGWRTDEKNRYTLWGEIIEAVQARLVTIPAGDGLGQFYSVIRNPEKGGRIEAVGGGHDDYPFAVGGAWQLRKQAGLRASKSVISYE